MLASKRKIRISQRFKKLQYFHKFSLICLALHTVFSFTILCKPFFVSSDPANTLEHETSKTWKTVRIYDCILTAFLPSAFIAMNYVIAVTPQVAKIILNNIAQFQDEAQGM